MPEEQKNLPCPFCGGTPSLQNRLEINGGKLKTLYKVSCMICHASTAEFETNYLALMAWNKRFKN